MTGRLYYTDAYQRDFDASVVLVDRRADGRTTLLLDRTAFYPTSGGQPFDVGTLAPIDSPPGPPVRVVEVFDQDGEVWHVIEGASPQPGEVVRGAIDWRRRFDHMQQHTGQHLLSAAFDRLFSAPTVGFHLGAESCTIDVSRETTPEEIAAAEAEANRMVWENRRVSIRFVAAEEAAALPLRKEPAREGPLRLVDIDGFDLSACGGTHVERTGAVGVIAATGWERFKGGQRLEFVCGGRALGRLRSLRDHIAASVRLLSVLPSELPTSIERLQGEAKDAKRAIAALQADLARYQAAEMAARAEVVACGRAVLQAVDGDAALLKMLASRLTAVPGRVAVLVSATTPTLAVIAASPDTGVAANQLLAALIARFGGRGGGKVDLAQGGGLNAAPQAILEEARRALADRRAADE